MPASPGEAAPTSARPRTRFSGVINELAIFIEAQNKTTKEEKAIND
jgi:hypothetical protein